MVGALLAASAAVGLLGVGCQGAQRAGGDAPAAAAGGTTTAPPAVPPTAAPGTTAADHGQPRSATGAVGGVADGRLGPPGDGQPVKDPLVAGQCFDELLDPSTDPPTSGLVGVDCGQPHDAETFLVATLPEPAGAPFPGDQAVSREAAKVCLAQFAAYVGREYALSSLRLATMHPVNATWPAGDRAVVCSLYDGGLRPLVGSLRGSGR